MNTHYNSLINIYIEYLDRIGVQTNEILRMNRENSATIRSLISNYNDVFFHRSRQEEVSNNNTMFSPSMIRNSIFRRPNANRNTGTNRASRASQESAIFSEWLNRNMTTPTSPINPINPIAQVDDEFLEPVPIRPTSRQVREGTEVIRYSMDDENENTSCPISLDVFQNGDQVTRIIHCRHVFSTRDLLMWFIDNTVCPLCRYDIRNYVPSQTNNGTSNNNTTGNTSTNSLVPNLANTTNIVESLDEARNAISTFLETELDNMMSNGAADPQNVRFDFTVAPLDASNNST